MRPREASSHAAAPPCSGGNGEPCEREARPEKLGRSGFEALRSALLGRRNRARRAVWRRGSVRARAPPGAALPASTREDVRSAWLRGIAAERHHRSL